MFLKNSAIYTRLFFFWFDSLGLAAFTVGGVNAGFNAIPDSNVFLVVFMGMLTGVGGGVLRDVMANQLPLIFVKHIYACASMLGALTSALLWNLLGQQTAMLAGFIVTIIMRFIAAHYKLNLPKIKHQ